MLRAVSAILALTITGHVSVAHANGACVGFGGSLDAAQVVPSSAASGVGLARVSYCDASRFEGRVGFATAEEILSIHLHGPALPGENGPVILEIPIGVDDFSVGPLDGAWLGPLVAGLVYVDVHTDQHPDGLLRGQLRPTVAIAPAPWSRVKQLYR